MAIPNADYCLWKFTKLYEKACKLYDNEDRALCQWFYRNQSDEYFQDIKENCNDLMKVRLKDNGGDPDCPINGLISGLFFTASVWNGEPLSKSPYGPSRVLVPVEDLLALLKTNLYFADFCCTTKSGYHYVILVITVHGSEADKFCRKHLPEVDLYCNPFLEVENDELYVITADHLLVEVFYTEDLDIRGYQLKDKIPLLGKGHSTLSGLRKNSSCTVCNL